MSRNVVDPGIGYRLVRAGEKVVVGTEYYATDEWFVVPEWSEVIGCPYDPDLLHPMRVPDNLSVGGPYVAIEVHRAALKEIDRLQWELRDARAKNPPKQQPEPEPEWFDLTPFDGHVLRANVDEGYYTLAGRNKWVEGVQWPEGTTVADAKSCRWDQFRCLLKDAPPELLKPAESPDDFVPQDRAPARPGIDERRWLYQGYQRLHASLLRWEDCHTTKGNFGARAVHGFEHPLTPGMRLELRCRRKDLPPIPEPKPSTQREVLLYWYDGNVVGRYADCQPTDQSFVPLILRDGKVFIETETREVVR